jgi:hypothetical protein
MAIAGTTIYQSKTTFICDVTCADADVTGTIAHGLNGTPTLFEVTRSVSPATTVIPNWAVTADGTNLTLTKNNVAGSGGGVPGTTVMIRVVAKLPQSIG